MMDELLLKMQGAFIPSSTGRARYEVTHVEPGKYVILTSPTRSQPSVLKWEDIERVYTQRPPGVLRTVDVDMILENDQFRHSATMCALVLAMLDPRRIMRDTKAASA
jgi:hypothetical protein